MSEGAVIVFLLVFATLSLDRILLFFERRHQAQKSNDNIKQIVEGASDQVEAMELADLVNKSIERYGDGTKPVDPKKE